MNLLYTLTAYLPYIGGAQIHTHQLAQQFLAQGDTVEAVAFWDENRADWLLGTTIRAPRNPAHYTLDGVHVQRVSLSTAQRAAMLPWVVGYYPLKPVAIRPLAKVLEAQLRVAARTADLVHNVRIGREPFSLASRRVARARNIPFCMTALLHPKWMHWYDQPFHDLYRSADVLFALTRAEKEMLVRLGVRHERIVITGHGPDVSPSARPDEFRARYAIDGPMILFLAEKRAYKGFQQLVAAASDVWRSHPETQFVCIGPRTHVSRAFFASVDDPRILELDAVSLQEKTDALAACDVLCVPSTQESFGGVYTEAWTQGKPVIGCDIPAVRDVIDEGVNGLLTAQQPCDIADKIRFLLDRPDRRCEMGAAGRAKVDREYSWQALAHKTKAAYRAVLEGRL